MTETLKRNGQLVVLQFSLADDATRVTPASAVVEVQVTGDPSARRLASVYGYEFNAPDPGSLVDSQALTAGVITRVTISAAELGIPVDPLVAVRLQKQSDSLLQRGAGVLENVVSKYLPEWRADAIIRFGREHSWIPSPRMTLPPAIVRQLAEAVQKVLQDGEALWLEFAEPVGYLPLVPWEQALRSVTSAPMLRLTPHSLEPVSSHTEMSTVLCVSVSSEKMLPTEQAMRDLLLAVRTHLPRRSTVHVFADALARPLVEHVLPSLDVADVVRLHPLPPATSPPEDSERVGDEKQWRIREHPWVNWMYNALQGEAVDLVHWISPGMFPDEGILVATDPAASPRAKGDTTRSARTLRFVPLPALAEFMNDIGAWGAIFSSPDNRRSLLGLRATTDRLARTRPGSAAMHDLNVDSKSIALGELYRFLIKAGEVGPPHESGVLLYSHPARTGAAPRMPTMNLDKRSPTSSLLEAYLGVASATGSVIERDGPTPAWVASSQRIAEQSVSRLVSASNNGVMDPAAAAGMTAALAALQRVLGQNPTQPVMDAAIQHADVQDA